VARVSCEKVSVTKIYRLPRCSEWVEEGNRDWGTGSREKEREVGGTEPHGSLYFYLLDIGIKIAYFYSMR
jgi:hypothetical protein